FVSHELLNPGVQEVLDELTTNLKGSQIYLTNYTGKQAKFAELQASCQNQNHIAIGVRSGDRSVLNPKGDLSVNPGDRIITIGQKRMRGF
ncbi:MAG: hypothetical protein ACPG77_21130, partial [Nannocystaceae bacterium]